MIEIKKFETIANVKCANVKCMEPPSLKNTLEVIASMTLGKTNMVLMNPYFVLFNSLHMNSEPETDEADWVLEFELCTGASKRFEQQTSVGQAKAYISILEDASRFSFWVDILPSEKSDKEQKLTTLCAFEPFKDIVTNEIMTFIGGNSYE